MDYTKIVKVLSLAATGNSIDAALDEMSKKELEYLLELCQEEKARRQAAKNGGFAMTAEASENIEKLVSILLTFSPEQMAEFVAGAREIIAQYK